MLESRIELLYEAIEKKTGEFLDCVKLFGHEAHLTLTTFRELQGMEEAFEIVAGMSKTDYFLNKLGV